MSEFEPKQFGKYFLNEKLAVGGMAEIYKAKTFGVDGFEKLLVLKRILPHCCADKDFITMLVDEAKLSVTLSHANIVQVYDLGKVGDDYFISMEYINGVNLRDIVYRCRERGMKIPDELATYIISEICKGLDYAHRKTDASGKPFNIVHRDVSPQNILLSYEGEVKIVDFGIAKAAMNISHTMAGILKGKIAYMSPEQALGKTVDWRADLFSTGIVLYEALTLEKLFTGESQFEVLKKIRTTRIDVPKLPDTVPEGLKPILAKALAYHVKDRYQTAGDIQVDLTKYLYTTHIDFTTQKLAAFIKDLFAEEIGKQHERGALEMKLEAQTSSINIAEEALQENLVHREDTVPTNIIQEVTSDESVSIKVPQNTPQTAKKSLGQKLAAVGIAAVLVASVAFAYFKFIHPQITGQPTATKIPYIPAAGTLNINSTPPGAKIFLDNQEMGLVTPAILENLTIGKAYTVKLKKDEFADSDRFITITSTDPVVTMNIELEVASGTLDIASEPAGAEIFVDGNQTGQFTPTSLTGVPLNTDINVKLIKEGFNEFEQTVKLTSNKPQNISAKLTQTAQISSIEITSEPAGAQIFLNGRDTGLLTPATIPNLTLGEKQNIRLVKAGYEGVTRSVTLTDTKPLKVAEILKSTAAPPITPPIDKPTPPVKPPPPIPPPVTATATVSIESDPAGAKIILNGKNTGKKTPSTLKNLGIGKNYTVRLEKQNYEPFTKEITVSKAEPLAIKGDLKELAPPPPPIIDDKITYPPSAEPASLKVSSSPSGAEVFINAEYKGTTPITISGIKPGTVSLLVNKEGKARSSQNINLKPGEKADVGTVKLGDIFGSVSVSSTPSGAKVIFDGDDIGARTPLTIKKVRRDKQHSIQVVLKGFKTWERTFSMAGEEDDKKFSVTLEEE